MDAKMFYNKKLDILQKISDKLQEMDELITDLRTLENRADDPDKEIFEETRKFNVAALDFEEYICDQYTAVLPLEENAA